MWCCKCELKTEALIFAAIYLVGSGISVISHLSMATTSTEESVVDEEQSSYGPGTGLFFSIVFCVIDGLLLYGIIKESRYYLIPWLALNGLGFFVIELLFLIFLPIFLFVFVGLLFAGLMGYPWYTMWKYFRSLDPQNLNQLPQTAVYPTTGFTNGQFAPDNNIPSAPPGTVVYTPGLPTYNDILAQPQNV